MSVGRKERRELEKLKQLSVTALKAKIDEAGGAIDHKRVILLSNILIEKQSKILSINRKEMITSYENRCIAYLMQHGDEKKDDQLKMLEDAKKDFEYIINNGSPRESHFERTNKYILNILAILYMYQKMYPPHEQSNIKQLNRISAIIQVLLDYLKERISDENRISLYQLWFGITLLLDKPKEKKEIFSQILKIYDKDVGTKEFFDKVIIASTELIQNLQKQKNIDIEAIEALYHICIKILMVTNEKTEYITKTFQNLMNAVYQHRPEDELNVYNRLIKEKIHDVVNPEEKKQNTQTLFNVFKKIKPLNKTVLGQLGEIMVKQSADEKINSSVKGKQLESDLKETNSEKKEEISESTEEGQILTDINNIKQETDKIVKDLKSTRTLLLEECENTIETHIKEVQKNEIQLEADIKKTEDSFNNLREKLNQYGSITPEQTKENIKSILNNLEIMRDYLSAHKKLIVKLQEYKSSVMVKKDKLSVEELNNEITNAFKTFNYQKVIEYEQTLIRKQKIMKVSYYKNLFTARILLYAETESDGSILKQALVDFESAVNLIESNLDRFEKTNILIRELLFLLSDHKNYVRQINDEPLRIKELNRVRIVINLLLGHLKEQISDANLILIHHYLYETTLFIENKEEAKAVLSTLLELFDKKSESTNYLKNVIFSTTQLIARLSLQQENDLDTIKKLHIICGKARIRNKENHENIAKTFQNLFDLVKRNDSEGVPALSNLIIQEIIHTEANQDERKENIKTLIEAFKRIKPREPVVINQLREMLKQPSDKKIDSPREAPPTILSILTKDNPPESELKEELNNSEENNILDTLEKNTKRLKETMDDVNYHDAIGYAEQNIGLLEENKQILNEKDRITQLYNLYLDLAALYLLYDPSGSLETITTYLKDARKLSKNENILLDEFTDRVFHLADKEAKKLNSIEKYKAISPTLEKIFTKMDAKPEHFVGMYGELLSIYLKADQEKQANLFLSKALNIYSEDETEKKSILEILLSRVPVPDLDDSSSHDEIFKFGPMILRLVAAKDYPKNILRERYLLLAVRQFLEKGDKKTITNLLKKAFAWSAPEEEKALYKKIIDLSINPERIDSKTAEGMISIFKEISPINPYISTLKETIKRKFNTLENQETPVTPIHSLTTQEEKISGKKKRSAKKDKIIKQTDQVPMVKSQQPKPSIKSPDEEKAENDRKQKAEKDEKLCNNLRIQSNGIKKDIDKKIKDFKKTFLAINKINKTTLAAEAKTKPISTAKKIISTLKDMEILEAEYGKLLKEISQSIEETKVLLKKLPGDMSGSESQHEIEQNKIYLENQQTQVEKNLNKILEDKQLIIKIKEGLKDRILKPYQVILDHAMSYYKSIETKKDDFIKNIAIKTSNLCDLTIEQLEGIKTYVDAEKSKIASLSRNHIKSIQDRLESSSISTSQDLANLLEISFDSIRQEIKHNADNIDQLTKEIEKLSSGSLIKVSESIGEKQVAFQKELEKKIEIQKLAEEENNKKQKITALLKKFDEIDSQLQSQSKLLFNQLTELNNLIQSFPDFLEPDKIILNIEMEMALVAKSIAEYESCYKNFESEFKFSSVIDADRQNRIFECNNRLKFIKQKNEFNQNNLENLKRDYTMRVQKAHEDKRRIMALLKKFDETDLLLQSQSTLLSRHLIEVDHWIQSLSYSQEPNKIILEIERRMSLIAKAIAEHESCFKNFESEFKLSSDIDLQRQNRIIKCDDLLKSIKKANDVSQNNLETLKHHYAMRNQKAQNDIRIFNESCEKAITEANECLALYKTALTKIKTFSESEYKNIRSKKLAEEKLFEECQDLEGTSQKLKKAQALLKFAQTCFDTSIMSSEVINRTHLDEIAKTLKNARQIVSDASDTFDQCSSELNSIKKLFSILLTDLKKTPAALDDLQSLQATLDIEIILKGGFSILCGALHYNSFEAAKCVGLNDIDGTIFTENPEALVNRLEKEGYKRSFTGRDQGTEKISFITIFKEVEGVKIELTVADPEIYPGDQLVSPLLSGKVRIIDEKEFRKDPSQFDCVEVINKNYIIAIDTTAFYHNHFKLATQGKLEGYKPYRPIKGIYYYMGHVNYLNLLRKAHEKFRAMSASKKTLVDLGKDYLSFNEALAKVENQFIDLFISGEPHPDYEIDKVLKEINPFNRYDLAEMLDKNELKQNIIEIKSENKGLRYRVVGLDNKIKFGFIPWDQLPPGFPRETNKILADKSRLLPYISNFTLEADHTSIYNYNVRYLEVYLRARIKYNHLQHRKNFNSQDIELLVKQTLADLASTNEIIDSTTLKKYADARFQIHHYPAQAYQAQQAAAYQVAAYQAQLAAVYQAQQAVAYQVAAYQAQQAAAYQAQQAAAYQAQQAAYQPPPVIPQIVEAPAGQQDSPSQAASPLLGHSFLKPKPSESKPGSSNQLGGELPSPG